MLAQFTAASTLRERGSNRFSFFSIDFSRRASNPDIDLRVVVNDTHESGEWNLLSSSHESATVRVVTIKHPPIDIDGVTVDNSMVGRVYDLSPQLAMLMIAAGWVRGETRSHVRRQREARTSVNRRSPGDRRSAA